MWFAWQTTTATDETSIEIEDSTRGLRMTLMLSGS